MPKPTCSFEGCNNESCSRGLCAICYGRLRRRGELELYAAKKTSHSISNVDYASLMGVCAVCGPTKVRHRKGEDRAECMTVRAKHKEKEWKKRRNGAPPSVRKPRNPRIPGGLDPRDYRLRVKYGITLADYETMYAAQQGACFLCADPREKLVVDHCHETGVVRGLLCHACNVGLGFFRDNSETLARAVDYVRVK